MTPEQLMVLQNRYAAALKRRTEIINRCASLFAQVNDMIQEENKVMTAFIQSEEYLLWLQSRQPATTAKPTLTVVKPPEGEVS